MKYRFLFLCASLFVTHASAMKRQSPFSLTNNTNLKKSRTTQTQNTVNTNQPNSLKNTVLKYILNNVDRIVSIQGNTFQSVCNHLKLLDQEEKDIALMKILSSTNNLVSSEKKCFIPKAIQKWLSKSPLPHYLQNEQQIFY